MAKAMSDTSALCVAQAFEECVYRRFGAPSLVRHDRDPLFMSEVFQAFAEMMQSRSRATLSYQPQANGQQERSVKTVMQTLRLYAEDPLQQDWDEIVERLVFAINNSQDTTRKETPFNLVHGWDAQSTLKAMASSLKRGFGRQSYALAWRREVNRQQEIALKMAKELDFDEELLPEDSWEPDVLGGGYEVESILDDRRPMETSTQRSVREFLVKWIGYDEPAWEPMTNLSCGGLLNDYLREKRSSQRFQMVQMVQVADED
ncbi:unnamed protein product [Phytophthora fragariaefolia]|uniref:Unnamed protein product n=1 Tax=Phytophthora fragariaefolia TaxID=1490495 RepID=A0A9W6XX30_9STRA|nr:unnamed protein product [Phytophthora fragariaefolia]